MKKWFRAVDPKDMIDLSIKLTDMYGYPWSGTDNNWYYSSGNIHNGVNWFYVYIMDYGHDDILTKLGFEIVHSRIEV